MRPHSALTHSLGLFALWTMVGIHATAQTYVHTYRFDPHASLLNIRGGFAGFDLDYRIRGTFGLVIDQWPGQPTTFGFTDVRAWLDGDDPFRGTRLDSLLRMSTWKGTLTNPFTIEFHGLDHQLAPIDAVGLLGDVVLLLNGSNHAPCCDFLEYHLDASTHIVSLSSHVAEELNSNTHRAGHHVGLSAGHGMTASGLFVPEPAGIVFALWAGVFAAHLGRRPANYGRPS